MISFIELYENGPYPQYPPYPPYPPYPQQNIQQKQGLSTGAKLALGAGALGALGYGLSQTDWYKNLDNEWNSLRQKGVQYAMDKNKQDVNVALNAQANKNIETIKDKTGIWDTITGTRSDMIDAVTNNKNAKIDQFGTKIDNIGKADSLTHENPLWGYTKGFLSNKTAAELGYDDFNKELGAALTTK